MSGNRTHYPYLSAVSWRKSGLALIVSATSAPINMLIVSIFVHDHSKIVAIVTTQLAVFEKYYFQNDFRDKSDDTCAFEGSYAFFNAVVVATIIITRRIHI